MFTYLLVYLFAYLLTCCDTKGYFNWRDQYIGAMNIRSRRRDLNVADRYLWFQSKVYRSKEQLRARSARAKQYARDTLADVPVKLSQIGAQLPAADMRYPSMYPRRAAQPVSTSTAEERRSL